MTAIAAYTRLVIFCAGLAAASTGSLTPQYCNAIIVVTREADGALDGGFGEFQLRHVAGDQDRQWRGFGLRGKPYAQPAIKPEHRRHRLRPG